MTSSIKIDILSFESYDYFCDYYMKPNKPCIFKQNLTDKWKSRLNWVTSPGKINIKYLNENFGFSKVPVVNCDENNSNCNHEEMSFKTYIEQCLKDNVKEQNRNLYLKDWHFNRAFPNYKAYEIPEYFKEDWLNEFCKDETDDFEFVYIGPKGTWTPFHADVFGSYSWSANICGKKRWLLFPPGQEKILQKLSINTSHILKELELLKTHNISYMEVIQEEGEVIFVPSGWYHHVWNSENTISINHNWFNRYNIAHIWNCLSHASSEVEKELSDLKGCEDWWKEHQSLLKAHHGMDLYEFYRILDFISKKRIAVFRTTKDKVSEKQILDLIAINDVCKKIINLSIPKDLSENLNKLTSNINTFLKDIYNIEPMSTILHKLSYVL